MDVDDPFRYLGPKGTSPDNDNNRMAFKTYESRLKPIACLEALLLGKQADRKPMESRPTEFLAAVLRKEVKRGADKLRVWYFTVDQAGVGGFGPLIEKLEADVAAGWKPQDLLHNHNFFFDKEPAVFGMPWPSANDVRAMRDLTIGGREFETISVTNGFVTSHLKPAHLHQFKGPDGK
jgi:hypothetical protein